MIDNCLKDTQSEKDYRNINIDNVGIEDLEYPIRIRGRQGQVQSTVAKIKMSVALQNQFRGTHMSRFLEVIHEYFDVISISKMEEIVQAMLNKFGAEQASIELDFPFFIEKEAPVSKTKSFLSYQCRLIAEKRKDFDLIVEVTVPIHSFCPCSREISKYGGHNQRGTIQVQVRMTHLELIEELVQLAEESASAEIYSLIKRIDEKYVSEKAYENPRFVEDIIREMVLKLEKDDRVVWYNVRVKNFESIHNHNAFASHEKWKTKR